MYVCMRKGPTGYPRGTPTATAALFDEVEAMIQARKTSDLIVAALQSRLRLCEIAARMLPVPGESDAGALFPSEVHSQTVWNFSSLDPSTVLPPNRELTILVIDEARQLLGGYFSELPGQGNTVFRLLRKANCDLHVFFI